MRFFNRYDAKIGVSQRLDEIIMCCVASVSYTVGINGFHGNSFVPSRGLRQGDPLSPYIFLLCAEGFSACLVTAQKTNEITGVRIGRGSMSINHLFFC